MKKNTNPGIISIMIILCFVLGAMAQQVQKKKSNEEEGKPFIFASIPDPHLGDGAAKNMPNRTPEKMEIFNEMQKAGSEYLLITGDWAGGHWEQEDWVEAYGKESKNRILSITDIIYNDVKWVMKKFNLKPIVCPGDHEYGDNPWPVKSERAYEFPFYREGFAKAFCLYENGNNIYNRKIGNVPERPIGTQYENTSFAFIRKNVMFVSLDEFYYKDPETKVSGEGVIAPILSEDQAVWLDKVLAAGRALPGVDFIIVQGHMPVQLPVYMSGSSGLTIEQNENSNLWKIMTKNKVDFYIGGEVHAVTVTQDIPSGLIQFVHGYRTFAIWESTKNKLKIKLIDSDSLLMKNIGEMTIDKTSGKKVVKAIGAMKQINKNDLLVHYAFDEANVKDIILNTGKTYQKQMQSEPISIKKDKGILGLSASFNHSDSSYTRMRGNVAVNLKSSPRSITTWIKTTVNNATIVAFGASPVSGMNIFISNGELVVGSKEKGLFTALNVKVNDGIWHMVAITSDGYVKADSKPKLYVDGELVNTSYKAGENESREFSHFGIVLGTSRTVINNFNYYYKKEGVNPPPSKIIFENYYSGSIDDLGIWNGEISPVLIQILYKSATSELKYNATEINDLYRVYSLGKSLVVKGKTWSKTIYPQGKAGDVILKDNRCYVIFDDKGNGASVAL